jgi:UDP-4-amino-4,6-dideoxy-N-acetyl-beta-L-altrosamine transaminase
MIPYGRQDVTEADIAAVVQVLRSDYLTQGPVVPRFERAIADYCGARHGIAVNSATSALHIACMALGLGPGDWLWTSPITFVASANCARYCGAEVDFVDIDPRTYNMSPVALEEKLVQAEREGRLPKVVVPVHLCGQPCDMRAIHALAQRYGFRVIEDASHAIGARYLGEPVGNGRYSDITVFSFHPVKIITSAEGGMAMTNDDALANAMLLYRSHGITRDPALMTHAPDGDWYYQQIALGYNYRLTELHAALGLSQAARIDEYVARRHEIADVYSSGLANSGAVLPWQHPNGHSALHLYVVKVPAPKHAEVFATLQDAGIGVNLHYIPVHLQPYYRSRRYGGDAFPEACHYYSAAISIPIYPAMANEDQRRVIRELTQAIAP